MLAFEIKQFLGYVHEICIASFMAMSVLVPIPFSRCYEHERRNTLFATGSRIVCLHCGKRR